VFRHDENLGRIRFDVVVTIVFPWMAGHPACPPLRATSLSLQGEPADIGKG
jgi:hypothetical protein